MSSESSSSSSETDSTVDESIQKGSSMEQSQDPFVLNQEKTKKRKRETKDDNERPKKKRKNYKTITEGYFLHVSGIDDQLIQSIARNFVDDDMKEAYPESKCDIIDNKLVRLLFNEDEKKKAAKEYRKNYSTRKKEEMKNVPLTDEQKQKLDELKKKRAEYNATKEVIERKKKKIKADRELIMEFKRLHPDVVQKKYDEILPKKEKVVRRRKKVDSEPKKGEEHD